MLALEQFAEKWTLLAPGEGLSDRSDPHPWLRAWA